MNQPLFGQNQQSPYVRQMLAQQLQQQSRPVATPLQGAAEMGKQLATALMARKGMQAENQKKQEALKSLQGAFSPVEGPMPAGQFGPGAPQEPNQQQIMAKLLSSPYTADIGAQMAIAGLNNQQLIEQEIAKRKALQPFELEMARLKAEASRDPTGGNTGALLDRLVEVGKQANPDYNLLDALEDLKGGAGARGKLGADINLGREAEFEKQTGQNLSDLAYKPEIANLTAQETEVGKQTGEARAKLKSMEAQYPRLVEVTDKLSDLGKDATYTYAGRAEDVIQRELGMNPGKDAVARTEYMATVDNEVLPLLRQTFGAQFTVQEGESLRRTLGDPNKSPEEKDAVLRAFIDQKSSEIESLRRQTDQTTPEKQTISLEEFLNEGD